MAYLVQCGNPGFEHDESIECDSPAEAQETVRDLIGEYREDNYRVERVARRVPRLPAGKSKRVALLISPVSIIAITVVRAV